MSSVTLVAGLGPQSFPATQAPIAQYQFTITGSASGNTTPVVLLVPASTSPVQVTSGTLIPDTYSVSAGQIDANGNVIGTPVSGSFTIAAPTTVTLQVVSTVSATVNP